MATVAPEATLISEDLPHASGNELFVDRVRLSVMAYIAKTHRLQIEIATEAKVSTVVLSQFLNRKYPGNVVAIAKALDQWLLLKQPQQEGLDDTIYIETQNSAGIYDKFALAHELRTGVLVYGIPGIGKSRTARQYVHDHPLSTIYIAVTPPIKSVFSFLGYLSSALGVSSGLSVPRMEEEIRARLMGSGRLLLLDEAERLMFNTIETIQGLAEATRIATGFITDKKFWEKISSGKGHQDYDRFVSRLNVRCFLQKHPASEDVAKIAKQFVNNLDRECTDYLTEKAAGKGGFRAVISTAKAARMLLGADKAKGETLKPLIHYIKMASALCGLFS
jgi:DNA transposition AAA+ family ATPase